MYNSTSIIHEHVCVCLYVWIRLIIKILIFNDLGIFLLYSNRRMLEEAAQHTRTQGPIFVYSFFPFSRLIFFGPKYNFGAHEIHNQFVLRVSFSPRNSVSLMLRMPLCCVRFIYMCVLDIFLFFIFFKNERDQQERDPFWTKTFNLQKNARWACWINRRERERERAGFFARRVISKFLFWFELV